MDPSPSLLVSILHIDIWTGTIMALTIVIALISLYQAQPSEPAYCMSWIPCIVPPRPAHPESTYIHTLHLYPCSESPQTNPKWPTTATPQPTRASHPLSGANKPDRSARQLSILDLEVR
ncbi:hypothetical protein BP00DRAFT_77637 [Aspergillus indologenus CBS 114.80]|uniref:Uncharacterized protein n=1 Tax=Aspergillus indologenus CBS 114.80 TaxID=1450541 RepID=A0A2V5HTL3_9EURO|nr:hypothetical protein BP00DRAFT_77637 [Aspergillus indologenus CBS 114.80]